MNFLMQVFFFEHMFLFLLGKKLGAGLLGTGEREFAFLRNGRFSKVMYHFILTPAVYEAVVPNACQHLRLFFTT